MSKKKGILDLHKRLAEILGLATVEYDIFCSYSHFDNQTGLIDKLLKQINVIYRALTGESLRIFVDRTEVITADLWESKILEALTRSRLLLALISPSYVKSDWCRREWFFAEEREYRINLLLGVPATSGVIAPALIYPIDRARFTKDEGLFVTKARERQWTDLTASNPSSTRFQRGIRDLVEDIIDQLESQIAILPSKEQEDKGTVIIDSQTGLMWVGSIPPVQMTFEEAKQYVTNLDLASYRDWRLPSEKELTSLIDPNLLSDDKNSSTVPLRAPFNSPRYGYLHSGSVINGVNKGHSVMNIRNGHIFNGKGRRAFVRAVRGKMKDKSKNKKVRNKRA